MFSRLFRFSAPGSQKIEKSGSEKSGSEKSGSEKSGSEKSGTFSGKERKAQTFPARRGASPRDPKKKASSEDAKKAAKVQAQPLPSYDVSNASEPIVFTEEELAAMSANYKELVGKGGFGAVYKGQILDTETNKTVTVAVKVLHSEEQDLEEDLMREIVAVAKLQNPFILRLVGYCNSGDTKALIYDYMGGGDVDMLLKKHRDGTKVFTWEQRLEVALGCAKALAFMHEQHFVHRDFKCANVLLTEDLSPRVADFGLVKFIQDWHSHCTTKVKGSIGYIDPMYFTIGHVHTKSDVYAFGVFLVEMITGKSVYQDKVHEDIIPDLMTGKVTEARVRTFLDRSLDQEDKVILQQAKTLAELARRSLQDHWESRPNMKDLVQKITRLKGAHISKEMPVSPILGTDGPLLEVK